MAEKDPHDRLFALLLDKEAVTWQTLIQELVRSEDMNPWDIDVSVISQRYISMLKKMKDMDFSVSGKVVLAAAILLKIKSSKLLGEDINELDRLMSPQDDEDAFYEEIEGDYDRQSRQQEDIQPLLPRSPQPRKRKVSIYDLIGALHKALEVQERRVLRQPPEVKVDVPDKKIDISKRIDTLHDRIKNLLKNNERVTFEHLLETQEKEEKTAVLTPLLHLANMDQRKINLVQKELFGDIEVILHEQQGL